MIVLDIFMHTRMCHNTVHLLVENKPKKELIRMLQQMGYDSDPVKAWKQAQEKVGHFDSYMHTLLRNDK